MNSIKIAVCQMTSVDNVEANFMQISELLTRVPAEISMAFFPENSLYMRIKEGEKVEGIAISDPVFTELSSLAKKRNICLHLGSVALRKTDKLSNASIFIDNKGLVSESYQKIHLFDIDIEGHQPVRESDVYKHGEEPKTLQHSGFRFGQSICYDLRFSELYSHYAQQAVEALLIPASFLVPTGKVHWEILLRARAIENQSYVIAAAQAGTHVSQKGSGTRETYGHSLVVDPWGKILVEAKTMAPEVLCVELSKDMVNKVRQQMPMHKHRRLVQRKS